MTRDPAQIGPFKHFWAAPHRPLFLAGIIWALVAIIWWPLLQAPVGLATPSLWHAHEMLVGFGGAAVAGYLLTALPNWTGTEPLQGRPLQALLILWVLGRLSTTLAIPPLLQVAVNSAFFLYLAMLIGLPILAARSFHKLGFVAAILVFGLGDAIFLSRMAKADLWEGKIAAQAGAIAFALLITTIASRAIPGFTRNALRKRGNSLSDDDLTSRCWRPAQVSLAASLSFQIFELPNCAGALLGLAALLMLGGIRQWRTRETLHDPLLLMLHVNFFWVPLGCAIVGFALLDLTPYPIADGLHILTVGAMSGLIMAISARAAATLRDDRLSVGRWFLIAFASLWASLVVRLLAPLAPDQYMAFIALSGLLWCLSWAVFIFGFRAALTGPPRRPVLSGRKTNPAQTLRPKV
ncbi:NnrS family protein [Aliisedimentitalea scapharcae]|uniref:NnrS family protein n=1 Tax=Aliisedimentitalea scapharcae TaxID=1524259 RepID=A0ABZ2XUE2_9RHOB